MINSYCVASQYFNLLLWVKSNALLLWWSTLWIYKRKSRLKNNIKDKVHHNFLFNLQPLTMKSYFKNVNNTKKFSSLKRSHPFLACNMYSTCRLFSYTLKDDYNTIWNLYKGNTCRISGQVFNRMTSRLALVSSSTHDYSLPCTCIIYRLVLINYSKFINITKSFKN